MVKYPALASEKSLPFSYDINHDVWHITYLLHSLTLCFSVFKGCTTSLSCPSRHTGFSAKRYVVLFWSSDSSKSLNFKPILIHSYYVFLVWPLGLPPVMIPLSACLGHAFRSMCCKLPILTKTPSPQYIFYAAQIHTWLKYPNKTKSALNRLLGYKAVHQSRINYKGDSARPK